MKKVLCMLLSAMLMVTALTGCGGNSSSDSSTPAASGSDSSSGELTYEEFTGENVFDAVEWAQKNFPDATPIRYANNTSTAAYQSNGGAIPAVCFYLAKERLFVPKAVIVWRFIPMAFSPAALTM